MKTEDEAAEVTLQQCENQVAKEAGHKDWAALKSEYHEVSDYFHNKVAELYASQVSASKDREIEELRKLIHDHNGMCQRKLSEQSSEFIAKYKEQNATISDQSKTIEELKKKLTEVKEVMNFLRMYGMIHTVKAVVYAEGSHEYFMKKAQALNS